MSLLGTSRITPLSLVEPAAATGHRLVAVAARDPERTPTGRWRTRLVDAAYVAAGFRRNAT